MDGRIFDIQRFSTHDGPGIRTTVFFKGCNLRCLWCHNPESQKPYPQLMFYGDKCVGCGECGKVCDNTFTPLCTACGRCVEVCRHGAREISGKTISSEQVTQTVLRDKRYYDTSGGGVTLSGGEPLLQPDFALDILRACRENGVQTAVETAANVPWTVFEKLLPFLDLVICDVKGISTDAHIKNTGVSNALILENAGKLMRSGKNLLFRMPYIPGYNDAELSAVRDLTAGFPLELMPYHSIGSNKYKALDMSYACAQVTAPDKDKMTAEAEKYSAIFDPAY